MVPYFSLDYATDSWQFTYDLRQKKKHKTNKGMKKELGSQRLYAQWFPQAVHTAYNWCDTHTCQTDKMA